PRRGVGGRDLPARPLPRGQEAHRHRRLPRGHAQGEGGARLGAQDASPPRPRRDRGLLPRPPRALPVKAPAGAVTPFVDFAAHLAPIRAEVDAAIARVLDSGWFVLGPEVEAFERELEAAVGAPHAIAVGNGTDAIELALRALDVGPGDEVVTSP